MQELIADLAAEQSDLDKLVADLDEAAWNSPTPAEGWAIRDQISHLAFFDERGALAASDPAAFLAEVNTSLAAGAGPYLNSHLERGRAMPGGQVLAWWRRARAGELEAFRQADPEARLPWFGPPMRATS